MTVQIRVRGSAERRFAPDRATLALAVSVEGPDRGVVRDEAVALHGRLTADLGGATAWSADQVRVHAHRPWRPDGVEGDLLHVARLEVSAQFDDFALMGEFLDRWAGVAGVEVGQITWDVAGEVRPRYEAEVRRLAVEDALVKAQAYADAVGAGPVQPVQVADAGMLSPGEPAPKFAMMAARDGGGVELNLRPEEIVVVAEVDAEFAAEVPSRD